MKMSLTSWSDTPPFSALGPNWPGVKVAVTQTGFQGSEHACTPYGFNLGTHVGDCLAEVAARREVVQIHMGAPIVWLNQVHGCDVHVANSQPGEAAPDADASVCTHSQACLAIMTADCLPVVFAAFNDTGIAVGVAAAHAGWRGLVSGVLQATARSLATRCGVPVQQIKAWMGPAIGPKSFEVGVEVRDAFVQQLALNLSCFAPGAQSGKHLADIYGLARNVLVKQGIRSVEGGGQDTFTDWRWFSHRRGQQLAVPSGRFATLIRLLPSQAA